MRIVSNSPNFKHPKRHFPRFSDVNPPTYRLQDKNWAGAWVDIGPRMSFREINDWLHKNGFKPIECVEFGRQYYQLEKFVRLNRTQSKEALDFLSIFGKVASRQ